MITESQIYWILKLDDIINAFIPVFILGFIVFIASGVLWIVNSYGEDNEKRLSLVAKKYFIGSIVCLLFATVSVTLIPTTKQMAMIKVIPAIANSEIVGEMSADAKELYRMGIAAIKEQLTGVTKEKEE